jgi:hypothetical protein
LIPDIILGIDLAERYSAAVLLEGERIAVEATADFGPREAPWVDKVSAVRKWWRPLGDYLIESAQDGKSYEVIIEDVFPFRAAQPWHAFRVQGMLMTIIADDGISNIEMVKPRQWQAFYGYKKVEGRTTKGWAKSIAQEFGYDPDTKGKATVDLRDAFLLARYRIDREDAKADKKGVTRFEWA